MGFRYLRPWLGLVLLLGLSFSVSAMPILPTYHNYNYNEWDQSVPSPAGYYPEFAFDGDDLGIDSFVSPQHMFVHSNQYLYLLDSGNSRIVVLDSDFKLLSVLDEFHSENGSENLNNPSGIFVTEDGMIFVADRGNSRVVKMDQEGMILEEFVKPQSELYPQDQPFQPTKVIVDDAGTVYVIAHGVYQGAVMYSSTGDFLGFYGSNRVQTTMELLSDFVWKRILSREQQSRMARYVPVQYSNFTIDKDGFIYTVTRVPRDSGEECRKLNPMGNNILRTRKKLKTFGDQESAWVFGQEIRTQLVDVHVDDLGFINVLDETRGRVFQYNQEGDLVLIFGGLGNQLGTFKNPVSIEGFGDRLIVLDSQKANVTVFRPTEFGSAVRTAVSRYSAGLYQESVEPWREVLRRNSNYELAYVGIGKAMMMVHNYPEAMKYFKLGYDRKSYSEAFKEYRTELLRKHFGKISLLVVIGLVLAWRLIKGKPIIPRFHRGGRKVVSFK